MIGVFAALAILWIALANRIWSLFQSRSYPKIAYTISVGFVAISFTLRFASTGFDRLTATPNLGDLIWHLALVGAGAASLLYIRATGGNRRPATSAVVVPAVVLTALMVVLWVVCAPVHVMHTTDLIGPYVAAGAPGVTAVVAFELFLLYWTVAIARFSWDSLSHIGEIRSHAVALRLTTGGACLAAAGAAITTVRAFWATTDQVIQQQFFRLNAWCSYGAALLVGLGVSIPTVGRYLQALRGLRRLMPLRDEVRTYVSTTTRTRFTIGQRLSPFRALAAVRTDIRDAFVQLHMSVGTERAIALTPDHPYAVGAALNDAAGWSFHPQFGRAVRYVLPRVDDEREDLDQLLRIAEGLHDIRTGAISRA
jgi:hypothetical protein